MAHPTVPAWVEFIHRDSQGKYYISAGTEIYDYDPRSGHAEKLLSFDCNMINGMTDDGRGHLFFSAFGRGLLRYDMATGRIKHFSQNSENSKGSLCNDWIMSLTADRSGHIWIATTNGICSYDATTDSFVRFGSGSSILEGKRCESLCETSQGDMLIGTMEGLYVWRRSSNTVEAFPDAERLRGLTIGYIVQDRSGDIWCSTSNGIWHYRTKEGTWVSHISGSGLMAKEYIANAGLYIPQDDRILFATADGITTFTPRQVQGAVTNLGDIHLTNLLFGGQPVKSQTTNLHFSFPYSDKVISMEFSLMNFLDAANTVFEYRLNSNAEWTSGGEGQNTITFAHLPIGTCQIEVRAIVGGVVSSPIVYTITIEAPWYRTTLAYILYILALIGLLGFVGLKWYRRVHRQLEEDKKQFIAETTEEIRSPLNLIIEAANLESSTANIQSAIEVIDSNARRIDQYIRNIEVKGNDELLMERIMKCINDNIGNSDLDVNLNIDLNVHGVGGIDTWGQRTLPQYTIDGNKPYHYSFVLEVME